MPTPDPGSPRRYPRSRIDCITGSGRYGCSRQGCNRRYV